MGIRERFAEYGKRKFKALEDRQLIEKVESERKEYARDEPRRRARHQGYARAELGIERRRGFQAGRRASQPLPVKIATGMEALGVAATGLNVYDIMGVKPQRARRKRRSSRERGWSWL